MHINIMVTIRYATNVQLHAKFTLRFHTALLQVHCNVLLCVSRLIFMTTQILQTAKIFPESGNAELKYN